MTEREVTLPEPRPEDDEDVVWGLSTASALWARGERGDAVVWLRRAAEAATAAGQDFRASELGMYANEIEETLQDGRPSSTSVTEFEVLDEPTMPVEIRDGAIVHAGPPPPAIVDGARRAPLPPPHAPPTGGLPPPRPPPAPSAAPPRPPPSVAPQAGAPMSGLVAIASPPQGQAAPPPAARPPPPRSVVPPAPQSQTQVSPTREAATGLRLQPRSRPPGSVDIAPPVPSTPVVTVMSNPAASHVPPPSQAQAPQAVAPAYQPISVPSPISSTQVGPAPVAPAAAPLPVVVAPPIAAPAPAAVAPPPSPPPAPPASPAPAPSSSPPPPEAEGVAPPPAAASAPHVGRKKPPRAPILDPWAEDAPPSSKAMITAQFPQIASRERAEEILLSVRARPASTYNEGDDVVTSAAPIETTLKRSKHPEHGASGRPAAAPPASSASPPPSASPASAAARRASEPGQLERAIPISSKAPIAPQAASPDPGPSRAPSSASQVASPAAPSPPPAAPPAVAPPPAHPVEAAPPSPQPPASPFAPLPAPPTPPLATTSESVRPGSPDLLASAPVRAPSPPPPPPIPAPPPRKLSEPPAPPPRGRSAPPEDRARLGDVALDEVDAFVDLPPDAQRHLAQLARIENLGPDEEVSGFGAALLLEGDAVVSATLVDAAACRVARASIVPSRGTLAEPVAVRVVVGPRGGKVAVWDQSVIDGALQTCPWIVEELASRADRLQALAGACIGPLGDVDETFRNMLLERLTLRVAAPHERVAHKGAKLSGIVLVGAGSVDLVGSDEDSIARPGDFLFPRAVLEGQPAPLDAHAGSAGALLLVGDRQLAQELFITAPPLVAVLSGET